MTVNSFATWKTSKVQVDSPDAYLDAAVCSKEETTNQIQTLPHTPATEILSHRLANAESVVCMFSTGENGRISRDVGSDNCHKANGFHHEVYRGNETSSVDVSHITCGMDAMRLSAEPTEAIPIATAPSSILTTDCKLTEPKSCNNMPAAYGASLFQTRKLTSTSAEVIPAVAYRQDEDGDTMLHLAIIHRCIEVILRIVTLTDASGWLDIENHLCQTPLHLAVLVGDHKIVRLLVARGARLDVRDRHGNTPLHLACQRGDLECVMALTKPIHYQEIGPCLYHIPFRVIPQEMNLLNYESQTCLHLAAKNGHVTIVEYLTGDDVSADVNIPEATSGRTVLHMAAERGDKLMLICLTEKRRRTRLDVNAETYSGETALQLAEANGQRDVVQLLDLIGGEEGSYVTDEILDISEVPMDI